MSPMIARAATEAEASFFRGNGWVHLPALVDPATIEHLRGRAEEVLRLDRRAGDFGEIVERNFRPFRGEDRGSDFSKRIVQSAVMGFNCARFLEVPRIRLLADGYLLKMPEQGGLHVGTLYHQDFPGNPVDRSSFLTIWIALHDMDAEQGVMRFYNRSHRLGVFGQVFADGIDLRRRCPELREADLSPPLQLRAGDATAHHSLTVHGAPPNRGDSPRWAYNILYMASDARYTASPGLFPDGVVLEPFACFEHSAFPLLPTG
jgi:Phytanoyl-CoA dioxygenase (PhyH)